MTVAVFTLQPMMKYLVVQLTVILLILVPSFSFGWRAASTSSDPP
jgi:hypothetical protein